jgi:hypothetical protein
VYGWLTCAGYGYCANDFYERFNQIKPTCFQAFFGGLIDGHLWTVDNCLLKMPWITSAAHGGEHATPESIKASIQS